MAASGERTRRDGFGVPARGSCPAVVKMGEVTEMVRDDLGEVGLAAAVAAVRVRLDRLHERPGTPRLAREHDDEDPE